MVGKIIRIEGLIVFLGALYFYHVLNASWLLFVILLLAPDLSMVGYLKDKQTGALTYNLVHNFTLAALLIGIGLFTSNKFLTSLGLILTAHIGADRFLGFGLKYATDFKDTHIQRL
ncbi:MAG: DUF4260 family protein [Bacillati bacterium ANGP1]|uniref:DUF4260 family protein n=1 Tax=Candidatus Segetimicrobium genomatis TaxID=2569760 RepID=A0A537LKG6_9BACT|nr:MAG: DUF4260 family protein [Terrabacteria group bacterium ANGP1]